MNPRSSYDHVNTNGNIIGESWDLNQRRPDPHLNRNPLYNIPNEQIFQNIKQEYSRYQRWRQLEVVLNQSEACISEGQSHSSGLSAPSSPGSSWMKKDQPTFTLRQVGILCERLLKDYEDRIREEYEQILNTKLAEQYESFVKFTHDQIMRRYGTRPTSYVS
ncbi:akirin-1 isoform X2 [Vombatus ursinus]|uniref:akirin-1 isoform X2 n=1 Tax=Vombatus ursinus TaxID=29139 RepID=UPI000FFD85EB|nr:akirin-1 isoform X2 [Vombatus ursinus]